MSNSVFIKGFSYQLGEIVHNIETYPELKDDYELLSHFQQAGLKEFWVSNSSPLFLAKGAIKKSLNSIETSAKKIDAIFYATSSFWQDDFHSQQSICELMIELGLTQAYPIGITFSFCGNFLIALSTAWQALRSEQFKNVLVITTDKLSDNASRIVPPKISIASDAASCCFLSTEEFSSWSLERPYLHFDSQLGIMDASVQFTDYMQGVAKGITRTISGALNQAQVQVGDINKVITNNYNKWVTPSMLRLGGIESHQVYLDNIPYFGHAGSADVALNLSEFLPSMDGKSANNLLLLSSGPMMWGSSVMRHKEY